jgi:thioredoxin-like negative regulator of GroEL
MLLLAVGCAARPPAKASSPPLVAPADPPAAAERSIRFVENDYERALAEARARKLPLFIDAWAPWCHSCLSLRAYVFPDPALRRMAPRFVWLSVDTEREDNASVVSKLGVRVLPTLYVIEPATEARIWAWSGSVTASELANLLDDAEVAFQRGEGGAASTALLRGHRASAEGKWREAIAAYREALAAASSDWPKRAQAVDGLVMRLADDKQLAECVVTGADEAPKLPPGPALADVVRTAIGCAEELPAGSSPRNRLTDLVELGEHLVSDVSQPILPDDRSDLFDYVVAGLRELGRSMEAKRVSRAWQVFLDDEARRAPSPAARAVFDAHRLRAYTAVGEPERALPMLAQSAQDFPSDYNPPARMAVAYLAMKRYDEALSAVRRAIGLAYGPRKLQLWSLEADIYEAKGDEASAKGALQAALDFARTLPLAAKYAPLIDRLAQRWAKTSGPISRQAP